MANVMGEEGLEGLMPEAFIVDAVDADMRGLIKKSTLSKRGSMTQVRYCACDCLNARLCICFAVSNTLPPYLVYSRSYTSQYYIHYSTRLRYHVRYGKIP